MSLHNVELLILTGKSHTKWNTADDKEWKSEVICQFLKGNYEDVLRTETAKELFCGVNEADNHNLPEAIRNNIRAFLSSSGDAAISKRELDVLVVGVACLQLFIQDNWIGPPTHSHPTDFLAARYQRQELYADTERVLSVDGEPVYNLTTNPEFLHLASIILESRQNFQHLQTADWWLMRCIYVHQEILDNKAPTLKERAMPLVEEIRKQEPLMTDDCNREIAVQFHLEAGYLCHTFYEYKQAHDHFNTARKLSGLSIELTGAMGKRTRFQQETKAQLVLSVTRENLEESPVSDQVVKDSKAIELPKDLALDDDTVLNSIQFDEGERKFAIDLSPVEQALVLGIMEDHRRKQASQEQITGEELLAYINCVLSQVKSWSVAMSALCLRSKLEKGSRRRVERAMMQLEETVNQAKRSSPPACQRLELFYCVKNRPLWILQKQLAELFLSIGSIGSALEVFERLHLWEDVISCYKRLGKMEKAETLIREQLAIKETPNLWCFLGDVTSHIEHYERAWELSNHRSARAQRCMAYLHLSREQYPECLACFEKSLKINSLQIPVWFTYGCAAMTSGEYKLAVKAFKRCVSIDYDNFEAWTNMATSYIRLKEKDKAYRVLGEALKCSYDNWRIWENYLVVSMDCGEFDDAIRSYNRLMDLKDKWVDVEILSILVRVTTEDIECANGKPGHALKTKIRELFGRITASVTSKGEIWRLYAQLCSADGVDNPENRHKILQYLQKAHRCVMQEQNWEKEVSRCKEVADHALQLSKTYLSCCEKIDDSSQTISMLSSAKLMLKGVLSKIKQKHTDEVRGQLVDDLQGGCASLESQLEFIVKRLGELKLS
ncbi:hypothetical protein ScPMuIL_014134 [Solemya velum]